MSPLITAIALLVLSIFMVAYSASRKENSLQHLTFRYAVLLFGTFSLFIVGTIILFIAVGWKWGLAGLGISWVVLLAVAARAGTQKQYVDTLSVRRVEEVNSVMERHQAELENLWDSTSPEKAASLMASFLDELRLNFPREFRQLDSGKLPEAVTKDLQKSIALAYSVGYMRGKGWITQEHIVDFSLCLGDHLAESVKLAFKGARSNGNAFSSGYLAVLVQGQLIAAGLKGDKERYRGRPKGRH